MECLSEELLRTISNKLGKPDLKNLRLASKKIYPSATRQLFAEVLFERAESRQTRCNQILDSPELASYVTTATLVIDNTRTILPAFVDNKEPSEELNASLQELKLVVKDFKGLIRQLHGFPNIQNINIIFDPPPIGNWFHGSYYTFNSELCANILMPLFAYMRTIPNLRSLSIKNLPNSNTDRENILSSPAFIKTLSSITKLKLVLTPELYQGTYDLCLRELPNSWLTPTCSNLTILTLHCKYPGRLKYRPLYEFRDLHFPKLKNLDSETSSSPTTGNLIGYSPTGKH